MMSRSTPRLPPEIAHTADLVSEVLVAAGFQAVVPWFLASDPDAEPLNRTGLIAIAQDYPYSIELFWRTGNGAESQDDLRKRILEAIRPELVEGLAKRGKAYAIVRHKLAWLGGRDDHYQPALEILG